MTRYRIRVLTSIIGREEKIGWYHEEIQPRPFCGRGFFLLKKEDTY